MKRAGIESNINRFNRNIYTLLLSCLLNFEGLEMKFKEKENSNNYLNRVKLLSGQEYSLFPESVWNNELAKLIFQMYQDEGFQNELFQNRQRIPFLESINYFTDKKNSSRLLKNDFQLNFDDFFFASRKTTGISPFKYVNNHKKAIIDTGKLTFLMNSIQIP